MSKSNVIDVDFRPQVRGVDIEGLYAELEVIDAALAVAHGRAREIEAEIRARCEDPDLKRGG
jgi:hypothetical protein